ncbi:MAG: hypothetical protein AVDCRST_MAG48-2954 [uncultured Friedmanniella sp.]|uniref:Uncharacterized protein n=1 Tax=uncultured Friedmanniella sp. TaxID=335381 RepID=A0A6J4LAD5_9ACTN|nr:MAG: hypothetical protein AVDCRST_MAG48-2954 [uncultured Friedmanniella sp.]
MSPELTVVVDTAEGDDLPELLRSLDESTLPSGRFELLLLTRTPAPEVTDWPRFAARRPNVRLVAEGDSWTDQARGTFLLHLRAGQRLFPEALERLLEAAAGADLDAVAGREVVPGGLVDPRLLEDATGITDDVEDLLDGPVVLRRRASRAADGAPPLVGVVGRYPATLRAHRGEQAGTLSPAPTLDIPVLSWEGAVVGLRLSGRVPASGASSPRPLVLVRELTTGLCFPVPSTSSAEPGPDDDVRWSAHGRLDLRTAAAGAPLPSGEWQLEVAVAGAGGPARPHPVPETALPVALVDDRVVVTAGPGLVLDVGPTARGCPAFPAPEAATVSESAAGCRLELRLTGWHVTGDQVVRAKIALDRLRLPAQVVSRDGEAVLTAFISGLAGTYPLSLQLGRAPLQPTGLAVAVAGDGAVRVTRAPSRPPATAAKPAAKKPAAKKAAAKKAAAKKPTAGTPAGKKPTAPATGPLARVRRAVPRAWEPQVERLAQVPALRTVYRRLTGLARR